eukprot:703531-Prymnesium_polylepis.1
MAARAAGAPALLDHHRVLVRARANLGQHAVARMPLELGREALALLEREQRELMLRAVRGLLASRREE